MIDSHLTILTCTRCWVVIQKYFLWIVGVTITIIVATLGIGINMLIPESQFWGTVCLVVAGLLTVGLIILGIIVWRQRDSLEENNAWKIRGARLPRFKLYEAACLLYDLDPLWPLINQKTKDEYASLIRAAKEYRLKIIPLRNGFTTTVGDDKAKQHMALLGEVMNKGVWKTLPNGERQVTKPAEALRDIEVDRKALRGYLESESRPVPEFLREQFDAEAARNRDFFS